MAAILVADQVVKYRVKTNMMLGEEFDVIGSWFRIHFTENEGFAFGTSFGGRAGKIGLTVFRLAASCFLLWFIPHLIRKETRTSLVVSLRFKSLQVRLFFYPNNRFLEKVRNQGPIHRTFKEHIDIAVNDVGVA